MPPLDTERPPAEVISVAALLRREGHGPHALDPPLRPRGHARASAEPAVLPRRHARKATAAAAALFAVGAVLGPAVLHDAILRPTNDLEAARPGSKDTAAADTGPQQSMLASQAAPVPDVTLSALESPLISPAFVPAGLVPASTRLLPAGDVGTGADTAITRTRRGAAGGRGTGEVGRGPDAEMSTSPAWHAVPPGSAPAGPGTTAPSAGRVPPGNPTPGGGSPGISVPGLPVPGLPVPGLPGPGIGTPPVTVRPVPLPHAPGGPTARAPALRVSQPRITAPDLSVSAAGSGARVATSKAAVDTPDVGVSRVAAGPAQLSGLGVELPDAEISGAAVSLSPDTGAGLVVPEVSLSAAEVAVPDAKLGGLEVPTPDLTLPPVRLPEVRLGAAGGRQTADEEDDATGGVEETGTEVVDDVTDTAGRALDAPVAAVESIAGGLLGDQD